MFFRSHSKPRVLLHLGMNKTGTTALQYWLSQNQRALLASCGFLYPKTGMRGSAHYGLSDLLGFKHGQQASAQADKDKRFIHQFVDEWQSERAERVCFSSENFVIDRPAGHVKELFGEYECQVLIYLRRHDHWFESGFKQSVKMVRNPNYPLGIHSFIKRQQRRSANYCNYRFLVDKWARVFGQENVLVRPYEKIQMPQGVVADFKAAVGLKASVPVDVPQDLNCGLTKRANRILEVAQRAQLTDREIASVIDFLQQQDRCDDGYPLLSPTQRRRLIEENLADYEYIAREYLGRRDGKLFYETLPREEDPWECFTPPGPAELVAEIAAALRRYQ